MGRYAQASAMDDHLPVAPSVSGQTSSTGKTAQHVDTEVNDDETTVPAVTDDETTVPAVTSDVTTAPATPTTPVTGGRRRRRRRRSTKKGRSRNGGTYVTEIATPLALLGATQYMKNRNARKSLKRRRSRKSYKNRSQKRRRRY
jgi:hypothetical protein